MTGAVFTLPVYVTLSAAIERRGCDLIAAARRIMSAGTSNKTMFIDIEGARHAAKDTLEAIERYERGQRLAEAEIDGLMQA